MAQEKPRFVNGVQSGRDNFLRPTSPHLERLAPGKSPASSLNSSMNRSNGSLASFPPVRNLQSFTAPPGNAPGSGEVRRSLGSQKQSSSARLPGGGKRSARSASPPPSVASSRVHAKSTMNYDLMCIGGTLESFAAASKAASCGAKVCVMESLDFPDTGSCFWVALRGMLRRSLASAPTGPTSLEDLIRDQEGLLTKLRTKRDTLSQDVEMITGGVSFVAQAGGMKPQASRFPAGTPPMPSRHLETTSTTANDSLRMSSSPLQASKEDILSGGGLDDPANTSTSSGRRLLQRSMVNLPREGRAYTEWNGPRHPACTRGHRGTFWGMVPPEQALAKMEFSREAYERANRLGIRIGQDGAKVTVLIEDQYGQIVGQCDSAHILVASGEHCVPSKGSRVLPPGGLEGSELCTHAEDIAEAFPNGSIAHQRVCIIGSGARAAELCAFCELGGAETSWIPSLLPGERPFGQALDMEVSGELLRQLQLCGRTTVYDGFKAAAVLSAEGRLSTATEPSLGGSPQGNSPRNGEGSPRQVRASPRRRRELFVRETGGQRCGPFDVVLRVSPTRVAVPSTITGLPGVQLSTDGRLLVDAAGSAGPFVSAVGAAAALRKAPPLGEDVAAGFEPAAFAADAGDAEALASLGTRLAALLFGSGSGDGMPLMAAVGLSTLLSCPPATFLGLSADDARGAFPPPLWQVEVLVTRHQAPGLAPNAAGHFAAVLVRVQRRQPSLDDIAAGGGDAATMLGKTLRPEELETVKVVGAALISGGCCLQLLSGLAMGLSVALESGASARQFETVLSAYPPSNWS